MKPYYLGKLVEDIREGPFQNTHDRCGSCRPTKTKSRHLSATTKINHKLYTASQKSMP